MRSFKRITSGVSIAVLTLSSLMTMGFTGVAHAASGSDTCTWTGTAGDSKFSTAGNWSGCSSAAPVSGDVIKFGVIGSGYQTYTLTNDLSSSVALVGVTYGDSTQDTTNHSDYTISVLHLSGSAVITGVNAQGSSYPNVNVRIGSNSTVAGSLTLNGTLGVPMNATTMPTLSMTDLTVDNNGYTNFAGGPTFLQYQPTGTVTIKNGSAYVGTGSEAAIVVENGATFYPYAGSQTVTYSVPVTYGGGSGTDNPIISEYSGDTTLTGAQTLQHNVSVEVADTMTITGSIHGSYTITKASDATGTLVINSSDNQSSTANATQATPDTATTISDSQPNTSLQVQNHSTTTLDGARGSVGVAKGGILKGTGTAGSLSVYGGGIVAPGHSPGKLTVLTYLSLGPASTYQAELKDAKAGDFDQIVVGSAADTSGNDVMLGDGTPADGLPTLDVQLYSGASIKAGDAFEIINNLSKTAVLGTFKDLPEGATFKVGNGTMKISYVGGDGNDVVLTALSNISAPDTGFALAAAHPIVTLGVSALAAATIFGLARKSSRKLAPARAKATRRR